GPGGEQPWAGYGCRSINAAALRMLARVLHDEARAHAVRVQLLLVDTPVRSEANIGHACPQWPSAFAVGERALALVDRVDTHERARAIVRYSASSDASLSAHDADTQRCLSDARVLLDSLNFKTEREASSR
ncbi:MAG: hypothetical protein H7Y19_13590, partial [Luteimonas sp.]|nr:hypothetical protein [Luteimonas sp.]